MSQALQRGGPAGPSVFVIFGSTGDLTKRKLVPALYNLCASGLLSREFAVVGIGRRGETHAAFRERLREEFKEYATAEIDQAHWEWLEQRLYAHNGNFDDPETYEGLARLLTEIDAERDTAGNYLFYLATPPAFFAPIVTNLGRAGLAQEAMGKWRRVIVEKPFGTDLDSALQLNRDLQAELQESQIYRIDHYLGKETVQNIMMLRFGNGIFEPIWNRQFIDHVQITVAETVGVGSRAGYYDKAGAMRDMVQNHLMQLIALTAMEPPASFDAEAVRDEKGKAVRAIKRMSPEAVLSDTVRGQYGPGVDPRGRRVGGYLDEPNVPPNSATETFVALELQVDNWRWAGVPFYLRTGKRLPVRETEISIVFKAAPLVMFRHTGVHEVPPNALVLHLQPDEGISLQFQAKVPGPVLRMDDVDMRFDYGQRFGSTSATGYETLVYDCMCGDATLFQRSDNVEAAWKVVMPILDVWKALPPRNFPNYEAGSWGPAEATALLARHGRAWRKMS